MTTFFERGSMRLRSCASLVLALAAVPAALRAQEISAGNYVRASAGITTPVNPTGTLRDWKRGTGFALSWENWESMGGGAPRAGFGIAFDYAQLPLDEQQFVATFKTGQGLHATSASANKTSVWTIATDFRLRIPTPLVMPTINFGFGIIDFHPSTVQYVATDGTQGSAEQKGRTGAELSIGGGIDRQIAGRVAVYAEALYRYGFTSVGEGIAAPGSACLNSGGCDALKNTSFGTIRGGLRIKVDR
ncbi:MAG TPA: hypothetical protein VHB25_02055 [Gemmatimonadaceae bacterium]|nr:hypothetical protein [Gemmatimonadaceae bacterium]